MNVDLSEMAYVAGATYVLVTLTMFAYKVAIKNFKARQIFAELKDVAFISLAAAVVSTSTLVLGSDLVSDEGLGYILIVIGAFAALMLAWKFFGKTMTVLTTDVHDFAYEVDAAPTAAQKFWLFLESWGGAVVMGLLFGTMVTVNNWKSEFNWLEQIPGDSESSGYVYFFLAAIAFSIVSTALLRRRRLRKLENSQKLRGAITYSLGVPALVGLFFASLQQFTRNQSFTNRYFTMFVFAWMFLLSLWYAVFVLPGFIRKLRIESRQFDARMKLSRKQKTTNKKRKRR